MDSIIFEGDCVEVMRSFRDECVDLVVTSPPYDDLRKYNGYEFNFTGIIKQLYRLLKRGGVIVWIVSDRTKNGSESGTSFKQALSFIECGFNLHDTMIWKKTNPMPRVRTKRYFDCFEYMFVFSKGKPKTFNPIMQKCRSGGKIYSSTCKNIGGESGRVKKTFKLNDMRYKDNIWECAVASNNTKHPAVFPEKLVHDHIISWSNEGDFVLDPFVGSGTSGIVAKKLKRNFWGIDISSEYVELARNRIMSI